MMFNKNEKGIVKYLDIIDKEYEKNRSNDFITTFENMDKLVGFFDKFEINLLTYMKHELNYFLEDYKQASLVASITAMGTSFIVLLITFMKDMLFQSLRETGKIVLFFFLLVVVMISIYLISRILIQHGKKTKKLHLLIQIVESVIEKKKNDLHVNMTIKEE